MLTEAGLSQDEYEHLLGRLATKTIVLKREPKECWINQYNTHLLKAWNANIDLQYVVDAYSCINYILSYISKKESEEGQLLKSAQKEAREGNVDAVKELRTNGQVYVTHREVSIMEAIYRATGMKLKSCSREVIWVPADEQSTKISLPLHILQEIAKQRGKETTDICQTSDVDRYWARPYDVSFNDMCLADFVSNYRLIKGTNRDDSDDSDNDDHDDKGDVIHLQDRKGIIAPRKRQAVVRYLKVSKAKDSERHYSTLM